MLLGIYATASPSASLIPAPIWQRKTEDRVTVDALINRQPPRTARLSSRERVLAAFRHEEPDRVPCWLGASPEWKTLAREYLHLQDDERLLAYVGDDFRRVYTRYGAEHVGLVCSFPTYRLRSAVREIGKALDLPLGEIELVAKLADGRADEPFDEMDNLPGFPNSICRRDNGNYWVGFTTRRSDKLDKAHSKKGMKKMMYGMPGFIRPKADVFGMVLEVTKDGKVLRGLFDTSGEYVPEAGSVRENSGSLYIGGDYVGYISKYALK